SRTKTPAPAFLAREVAPSILGAVAPLSHRGQKGQSVGWLDRFPGRKPAGDPLALASLGLGDEVHALGERWEGTAIVSYRDRSSEWPGIRIERNGTTAWLALAGDPIVRYGPNHPPVGPHG